MLADQNESDQLAAMYDFDAWLWETKRKKRENKKSKKKMKGLELDANSLSEPDKMPNDSNSTRHVNYVGSSEVGHHKTDGSGNTNSTPLITEVQSGDGSEIVEEYNNGERNKTCVRSDCGINGGNYVHRTKAEEYKMNAELGICPQLSAMISPEARMKNAERNEKEREQLTDAPIINEGLKSDNFNSNSECGAKAEEHKMLADQSEKDQLARMYAIDARRGEKKRKIRQNKKSKKKMKDLEPDAKILSVACVADEQGGSVLEALEGHEETACLGTTRGNPEIEQTEAPVREVEKVFDRRDGGDIAAEIVKHGDSTKAAETAPSLKLGSMKKKDNFMLRKLLRKPRYYDFSNSSLQMCHICGEDDHKAAECTMVRRKKPCYICGGFRHTAKRCSQGRECFKCGGRGHLARACLEEPSSNNILDFCLRCGDLGHHMFICRSDYSSEDLKAIKCYVCKEFGHLCCDGFKYEGQTVASCYKCGQSGHLGSECVRQEKCTGYSLAKSFCDHEVKGQFAGMNGEHSKAGQCAPESTRVERSFLDNEIIPNLAHVPL